MSTRYEIQDQQWRLIQNLFPPERKPQGGRPAVDNRWMLNAMLWVARSGAPWRDLCRCQFCFTKKAYQGS
ncbi:transposase [Paenibacillus sp. Mc5Re-14]|uniref:transposase n=1 Tax=Paenibacillus sp. Mc5Re-14 TaxID=1030529 RepID=UPI000B82E2AB|nr:transposase [Paenibacillus sp. Mc5Re-14]